MGASVWAVVEYQWGDTYFSFGEINLMRDVEFLCAIAWGDGGITDDLPFPPCGFPPDASYDASRKFFVDAEVVTEYLEASRLDEDDELSLEEYARDHGDWAVKAFESSGLLPQPELTDYGWLTLPQLEANLSKRGVKTEKLDPVTRAMLVAMGELATAYGRDGVRLVFWIGL